jgi:hypothetical protein
MTYTQDSKPWATVGVYNALVIGKSKGNSAGESMRGARGIITA